MVRQNPKANMEKQMTDNDEKKNLKKNLSHTDCTINQTNNSNGTSGKSVNSTNNNQKPPPKSAAEKRTNGAIRAATIVIAFATICYVFVAFLQWKTMSGQLGQMINSSDQTERLILVSEKQSIAMQEIAKASIKADETARLRDRAFVYFPNPRVSPYPSKKDYYVWEVIIVVSNWGSMPARHASLKYATVKTPISDEVKNPWPLAKWSSAKFDSTIGPKQSAAFQGQHIQIEIFKKAIRREIDIFILAEVTYVDEFDPNKTRTTQMSRKLRFDSHGDMSQGFTDSHNCSDDDCHQ